MDLQIKLPARDSSRAPDSTAVHPQWPVRLREWAREFQVTRAQAVRGHLWQTLHAAMLLYLRIHGTRLGRLDREDLEDVAAEKALDLLRKIEAGQVDFTHPTPGEITSYISRAARNALIDSQRARARLVDRPQAGESERSVVDPPNLRVERREFIEALRDCFAALQPRTQRIWFLRVIYRMQSRDIALHPDVGLTVNHVDVIAKRAREAIRRCMRASRFESRDMPTGTFAALWRAFHDGSAPRQERVR